MSVSPQAACMNVVSQASSVHLLVRSKNRGNTVIIGCVLKLVLQEARARRPTRGKNVEHEGVM